jgi:ABC-2 type transport system permease protein
MNSRFPTLIRREFWEYRSLWIAPLAVAVILLCMTVYGAIVGSEHLDFNIRGSNPRGPTMDVPMGLGGYVYGVFSQISGIAGLASLVYLLDCLHAERKDRSILFWKSLPVSDQDTVLSKLSVAIVIVPVGAFLLSFVVFPLIYAIGASMPSFAAMTGGWDTAKWLQAEVRVFTSMLVTVLWYLPVAAWAMLSSVVSRRAPIMVFGLPFVVVAVCENILFKSAEVWRFIGRHLMPIFNAGEGITRTDLWVGLAVAAGMLYIVVRLRRYRDDT